MGAFQVVLLLMLISDVSSASVPGEFIADLFILALGNLSLLKS